MSVQPDGNDADHLADGPVHELPPGRDPVTSERLASQPIAAHHVQPGHDDPLFGSSKTHDRADDLCRALGVTMTIGGKAGQDQRPEGGK